MSYSSTGRNGFQNECLRINSKLSRKTAHKTLHTSAKLNNFLVLIILLAIPVYALCSKSRNTQLLLTGRRLGLTHSQNFRVRSVLPLKGLSTSGSLDLCSAAKAILKCLRRRVYEKRRLRTSLITVRLIKKNFHAIY